MLDTRGIESQSARINIVGDSSKLFNWFSLSNASSVT